MTYLGTLSTRLAGRTWPAPALTPGSMTGRASPAAAAAAAASPMSGAPRARAWTVL